MDICFAHFGVSPAGTVLNDLIVGIVAALLAYAWATLLVERHFRDQLAQRIKKVAVLEERNRIARELHDTVAQKLAAIVLQLEAGDSLLRGQPVVRMRLHRAADLAREGVREARESVWNLRPEALRGQNLSGAFARLAKDLTEGTQIRVEFSFGGSIRQIPENVERDLLRIGQEALTNAVKHSRANKVNVTLALAEEQVGLSVEDDGIGFVPRSQDVPGSFGLAGMQERARALGGMAWIYSQPGRGTSVQAVLPLGPS